MFHDLMRRAGLTAEAAARRLGVSESSVRKWASGQRPNLSNAVDAAGLFHESDGRALLEHWEYEPDAWKPLQARTTHDPAVANGWRLDSLIDLEKGLSRQMARMVFHLENIERLLTPEDTDDHV